MLKTQSSEASGGKRSANQPLGDQIPKQLKLSEPEQVLAKRPADDLGNRTLKKVKIEGDDLAKESADFVRKTLNDRNYGEWLTQADIANIARTSYGWYGEDGNVVFEVIGSVKQLGVQLERHKNKLKPPTNKKSLTFIINLNNYHWITLVVAYENQGFSAYYIDSMATGIQDNVSSKLNEKIPGISIRSYDISQQKDGYNCGVFALENAGIINDALQSSQSGQIEQRLSSYKPTPGQLQAKRREFANPLLVTYSSMLDSRLVGSTDKEGTNKEVPQDFELIQLLIEEATAGTPVPQKGELDRSLKARFQSFINQIPSHLHSVGKSGFFTHFFFGSFAILQDTQIAGKLGIKDIYFRFDGSGILKVAVVKNGEIKNDADAINNIKLFSISGPGSESKSQFTSSELENILNLIGQNEKGGAMKDKIKDRMESRSVQISKKKKGGFSVEVGSQRILDHASQSSKGTGEFSKIEKGLWANPEANIASLSSENEGNVKESLNEILKTINRVYSKYKNSLSPDASAQEAAHHAFIAGIINNFRYRYNLKSPLELLLSRGYADFVLLTPSGIPVIVEVKAGNGPGTTPNDALKQVEGYAQWLQPSAMRFFTGSATVLCVGINLDHQNPISEIKAVPIKKISTLFLQDILESAKKLHGELTEDECKKQILDIMEHTYHIFPGTPESRDNHQLSRFLLGKLTFLDKVSGKDYEKHIFSYSENIPTEVRVESFQSQRQAAKDANKKIGKLYKIDANHGVVTVVLTPQGTEGLVYVINIVEADGRTGILSKRLPLDDGSLKNKIGNKKIVELNLNLNIVKLKSDSQKLDFKEHSSIEINQYSSLEDYNNKRTDKFQGTFTNIPYPNELKETLDGVFNTVDRSNTLHEKLDALCKKIGEGIFPFKDLIENETHFREVVYGVFYDYISLRLQKPGEKRVTGITEFQLGKGDRIDVAVCAGNVCIGFELKGPREKTSFNTLKNEVIKQKDRYVNADNFKIFGNVKVFVAGVVYNSKVQSSDKLLDVIEPGEVNVVHSSKVKNNDRVNQSKRRKPLRHVIGALQSFEIDNRELAPGWVFIGRDRIKDQNWNSNIFFKKDQDMREHLEKCKESTDVDLSSVGLEDGYVDILKKFLGENKSVTNLDLYGNNLKFAGVRTLIDYLIRNNRKMSRLILSNNEIVSSSGPVTRAIKSLASLIKKDGIVRLEISDIGMRDAEFRTIFNALKKNTSIERLDLSDNRIGRGFNKKTAEQIADVLYKDPSKLTSLDLADTGITDDVIKNIMEKAKKDHQEKTLSIQELYLDNNPSTEEEARGNRITEEGMKPLVELVKQAKDLKTLELSCNPIGEGVGELINILEDTNISTLGLHDISLTHERSTQNIAEMMNTLISKSKVSFLDLGYNDLGEEAVEAIFSAMSSRTEKVLKRLDLSGNWIAIGEQDAVAEVMCKAFQNDSGLEFLSLANMGLSDVALAKIIGALKRSNIKSLNIAGNCIGPSTLTALSDYVQNNQHIKFLNIAGPSINYLPSDEKIIDLKSYLLNEDLKKDIEQFKKSFNDWNAGQGDRAEVVNRCEPLRLTIQNSLSLVSNDEVHFWPFREMEKQTVFCQEAENSLLKAILMSKEVPQPNDLIERMHKLIETLENYNKALTSLLSVLGGNPLPDNETKRLFEALKNSKALTHLDMSHHVFAQESINVIYEYLGSNSHLHYFDLANCQLTEGSFSTLFEKLKNNIQLRYLNIASNQITTVVANKIIEYIKHTGTQSLHLQVLVMSESGLSRDTVINMRSISDQISVVVKDISDGVNEDEVSEEADLNSNQCTTRRKRNIGMACIDSHDEEDITKEGKERHIKELFNDDKILVRANTEFYDRLLMTSNQMSEGLIAPGMVEDIITELKSRFSLNSGVNIDIQRTFIELYGHLKIIISVSDQPILDESLLRICKIDLLKIISPIIRDENFKRLLENNPEELLENAGTLGLDNIFEEIYNKVSSDYQLQPEELKNKIDQEIFDTNRKRQIKRVADGGAGNLVDGMTALSSYVYKSMELSKTLLSAEQILIDDQKMAIKGLQKLAHYNTLVDLGMLIDHHFKVGNLDDLENRISDNQLSMAYGLYIFRNKVKFGYNELSGSIIKDYFLDNVRDFYTEIEAYGKTAVRYSVSINGLIDNQALKQPNSYELDQEGLHVKLKVNNKEFLITEGEKDGKFYLQDAEDLNSITQFTDVEKTILHDHLRKLFDKQELLAAKKSIEDIADDGYCSSIMSEIKSAFLNDQRTDRMIEDDFNRLESKISAISKEAFEQYIDSTSKSLKDKGIVFDQQKFDLAKTNAHKGGKFFALMAIYDLYDSARDIKDAATLGRHDNQDLKIIFGINGIFDSMNDVRTSITLGSSIIGRGTKAVIGKIPSSVRQSFVKIIDNPIVSSITFVTISYQFGYSLSEIIKGNHHPLNYYWVASSGVKIASMGMKPIGIGVNYAVKSTIVSTRVLRTLLAISKVLSKVSLVTTVLDFGITIGVEAYESMKYTESIARQLPLLDHEAREVFFKGVIKFFTGRNVGKKYEDLVKIKNYLNYNKLIALEILEDLRVAAVVQFPHSFQENYREVIEKQNLVLSPCNQVGPQGCSDSCVNKKDDASLTSITYYSQKADLSLFNMSKGLTMKPYTLRASALEEFECGLHYGFRLMYGTLPDWFNCSIANRTQVLVLNQDAKHLPHLTIDECNSRFRYISVPWQRPGQVGKEPQCGPVINELKSGSCNVGKIYRNCQETFTLSGEPFIFANLASYNINKIRRISPKTVYIPGPHNLTAAENYPAVMYVTNGTGIHYTGSRNHETTFVITGPVKGTLEGGPGKGNTVVMNFESDNQTINLFDGHIYYGSFGRIDLVNTYNYISNFSNGKNIFTHCKTTFIDVKNATIYKISSDCQNQDHEVIMLNSEVTYLRNPKQATLFISKNSNNSRIVNDFSRKFQFKQNADVIEIIDVDIKQLKITENMVEGGYVLNVLDYYKINVISSVKIDNFENLIIKGNYRGSVEVYITMQGKFPLLNLVQSSRQELMASIRARIPNRVNYDAYQVAKGIADGNNLGVPISRIEAVQEGILSKKAIISTHLGQIAVDFNCGSQSTDNTTAHDYCQNVDVEGGGQYSIKLLELSRNGTSLKISEFHLNIKRRDSVSSNPISFTMFDRIDINSTNITKGSTDSLVVEMTAGKLTLSVSLSDYFKSPEQHVVLQMNNKFYGINNVNLELERLEKVNSDSIRYYKPGGDELQIYHNQPTNEGKIGLVDLKDKSMLDFKMNVINGSLLLSYRNNTVVKVENWNTYQPAREVMFAFNGTVVFNPICVMDTACEPESIVQEFDTIKSKHRHHHGDYGHYHLSRKPLAMESNDDQPKAVTSSASEPSSWINGLFGLVKDSVGRLFCSKVALSVETTSSLPNISRVDAQIDGNGILMGLNVLVRKITGQKFVSTVDQPISSPKAQNCASSIKDRVKEAVKQAADSSGIGMHQLEIDFLGMEKEVTGKIMSSRFNEIPGVLKSHVEKALPGREPGDPGRLSKKKFDKFMTEFNKGLDVALNQSKQQLLYSRLGVNDVKEQQRDLKNEKPKSYLNNTSVQGYLTQARGLKSQGGDLIS